jgi:hypothetical protein
MVRPVEGSGHTSVGALTDKHGIRIGRIFNTRTDHQEQKLRESVAHSRGVYQCLNADYDDLLQLASLCDPGSRKMVYALKKRTASARKLQTRFDGIDRQWR